MQEKFHIEVISLHVSNFLYLRERERGQLQVSIGFRGREIACLAAARERERDPSNRINLISNKIDKLINEFDIICGRINSNKFEIV